MKLASQFMSKFWVADAMMRADDPQAYAQQAAGEMYAALGGDVADLMAGTPDPAKMALTQQVVAEMQGELGRILTDPKRPAANDPAARAAYADAWLEKSMQPLLEEARRVPVSYLKKTAFNTPPAIFHRVAAGERESSPFLRIDMVATVVPEDCTDPA